VCNLDVQVKCHAGDAFNWDGGNSQEVFVVVKDELLVVIEANHHGDAA